MPTDRLYDLAFQLRKIKLWKQLYDSQLFAVRHADGTIGYCCAMGMLGEHLALAVYPGDEGMRSYRRMGEDRLAMDSFALQEAAFAQNCVMVSFESKDELRPRELDEARRYCKERQIALKGKRAYPQFKRFRPHYFPWYVDDAVDQARLLEGMEACIEVSARLKSQTPEELGFTEGVPFERSIPLLEKIGGVYSWSVMPLPEPLPVVYPSPEMRDDLTLAKLKKSKKAGGEWACDIFMHVQATSDEEGDAEFVEEPKNAPFFPYLLMIVDNETGLIVRLEASKDPEEYAMEFMRSIVETVWTNGAPTRILVCNERTRALFANLAGPIGAKLLLKKSIPQLEEAKENFWEHFSGDEDGGEDSQIEQVFDMLRDAELLKTLPEEMIKQFMQAVQEGVLPKDVADIVRSECWRRGM